MGEITVTASVDEATAEEASAVLAGLGFSVSDAVRLLMKRIAVDGTTPFALFEPNDETIEAMEAARRGETVKVGSVDELFAWLNEDD